MTITKRWWAKAAVYRAAYRLVHPQAQADFSDEAAQAMFDYESSGAGRPDGIFQHGDNGYALGKKALDLMLAEWRDGAARGLVMYPELKDDLKAEAGCSDDSRIIYEWFLTLPPSLFALSRAPSRDLEGRSPHSFMEAVHRASVARHRQWMGVLHALRTLYPQGERHYA